MRIGAANIRRLWHPFWLQQTPATVERAHTKSRAVGFTRFWAMRHGSKSL